MRRANAQLQSDRRAEILAAAHRCFVRSGFHGASMQDICAEAGMSAGNLYRYFPSKEALIAGIAERDRAEVAQNSPASTCLGACSTCSRAWRGTTSPATRGARPALHRGDGRSAPQSGDLRASMRRSTTDVRAGSRDVSAPAPRMATCLADVDFDGVVTMVMIITDGLWWRRAFEPEFDPESVLPLFMDSMRHMLRGPSAKRRCGAAPARTVVAGKEAAR